MSTQQINLGRRYCEVEVNEVMEVAIALGDALAALKVAVIDHDQEVWSKFVEYHEAQLIRRVENLHWSEASHQLVGSPRPCESRGGDGTQTPVSIPTEGDGATPSPVIASSPEHREREPRGGHLFGHSDAPKVAKVGEERSCRYCGIDLIFDNHDGYMPSEWVPCEPGESPYCEDAPEDHHIPQDQ